MKKISLLGAGWLGEPLAVALQQEGYAVQLATASTDRFERLKLIWDVVAQIRVSSEKLEGAVQDFLNAAILIINIPPNRQEFDKEQFAALIPLLEQSPVQQVLFVSSTGVYQKKNTVVQEDKGQEDVLHPLYKSEQLFLTNPNFQTTVVRLAGLIGGERHPGRFFAKSGRISNSLAPVNLVGREDCILVILEIIKQQVWGEIFNVCANEHPLKGDFYPATARAIGLEAPVLDGLLMEGSFCLVANEKVKKQLGVDFLELAQIEY